MMRYSELFCMREMRSQDMKIPAVIIDWAGSAVDFGRFAPVAAF